MKRFANKAKTVPSLRQAVYGFVLIGLFVASLGAFIFASVQRDAYQSAALELAVQSRLQGAAVDLTRSLQEDWARLSTVAENALSPASASLSLTAGFSTDKKVRWAGVVDPDGNVRLDVSTGDLDLTEQSWLRIASAKPYLVTSSDVSGLGPHLIMARPMQSGFENNVFVLLLPLSALQEYADVSGTALGIDLFLVSQKLGGLPTSAKIPDGALEMSSLRSASAGISVSNREVWPDGRLYFSAVVGLESNAGMPPTGLYLVGRMDPLEFEAADKLLLRESLRLAIILISALIVLTVLFIRVFIAPFTELARSAERIADGYDEYPFEGTQTKELATLSTSISRMKNTRIARQTD